MSTTLALGGAKGAGKTTLARALGAGGSVTTDAATGATLVTTRTASREYLFVDAPADGVEIVLGRGVQGLVLVVSATDGPLPATRAHVEAARLLGVPVVAVYLSVPDGIDVELVDLVELECRELVVALRGAHTTEAVALVRSSATRVGHGEPDPSVPLRTLAAMLDGAFVRS